MWTHFDAWRVVVTRADGVWTLASLVESIAAGRSDSGGRELVEKGNGHTRGGGEGEGKREGQ
jgi:hypothetical protein